MSLTAPMDDIVIEDPYVSLAEAIEKGKENYPSVAAKLDALLFDVRAEQAAYELDPMRISELQTRFQQLLFQAERKLRRDRMKRGHGKTSESQDEDFVPSEEENDNDEVERRPIGRDRKRRQKAPTSSVQTDEQRRALVARLEHGTDVASVVKGWTTTLLPTLNTPDNLHQRQAGMAAVQAGEPIKPGSMQILFPRLRLASFETGNGPCDFDRVEYAVLYLATPMLRQSLQDAVNTLFDQEVIVETIIPDTDRLASCFTLFGSLLPPMDFMRAQMSKILEKLEMPVCERTKVTLLAFVTSIQQALKSEAV